MSPVELVDACIERIERRNDSVNAFVYRGFDEARERARAAKAAVTGGDEQLGPLHGVPTAIKDLFDFKPGWPATFGGIRAFEPFSIDARCADAERMEEAGAIIVGKTNSPVMGFRGTCDNYLFGPSRNPFDLSKNTGGSSGGSAAAVADGLVPIAEGTDGGGSVRIPASWCGIYGYKASFGRVPYLGRPNGFGGTDPFLFEGTSTRTVADAALDRTALAGYHPGDRSVATRTLISSARWTGPSTGCGSPTPRTTTSSRSTRRWHRWCGRRSRRSRRPARTSRRCRWASPATSGSSATCGAG